LKHLAGEKQMTFKDLVDAHDYETVMTQLRRRVIKEVLESSTRQMFEHHLGNRFDLFKKDTLWYAVPGSTHERKKWGIDEIEALWSTRHKIVHEGNLSVDEDYFHKALSGCAWIEIFLSVRAQETYGLTIDEPELLKQFSTLYAGVSPLPAEYLYVLWGAAELMRAG
jgi:hypothetical protein